MIGTLNATGKFSLSGGAHSRAAMPANVVKGTRLAGVVARNDDAFAAHVTEKILARLSNLLGSARADPSAEEESFHFLLE